MENYEEKELDPQKEKLMQDMKDFLFPKIQELQEKLSDGKMGTFKLIKIASDFSKKAKKEYSEKYGRELEKDMRELNEYFDIPMDMSQFDLMGMLKKFKK